MIDVIAAPTPVLSLFGAVKPAEEKKDAPATTAAPTSFSLGQTALTKPPTPAGKLWRPNGNGTDT